MTEQNQVAGRYWVGFQYILYKGGMDMSLYSVPHQVAIRRAKALDFPESKMIELCSILNKWIQSSGPEWAVSRFKAIKQDIINYAANGYNPSTPWIARSKSGKFKGIFGYLQNLSVISDRQLRKVINVLNIYTYLKADQPLPSQIEKFRSAVSDPGKDTMPEYLDIVDSAALAFGLKYISSYGRKIIANTKPLEHVPPMQEMREDRFMREIEEFLSSRAYIEAVTQFPKVVFPLFRKFAGSHRPFGLKWYNGRVHLTQNEGLKARFYLAPALWLQEATKPLGKVLYQLVESSPWDCTHNQEYAIPFIQSHLSGRRTVHCFDLSSATDRFPLDLQLKVLKKLFLHPEDQEHLDFLEWVLKKPSHFFEDELTWMRGQPLGLYPSFAMFTLTHGLLLYGLNGQKHNNKFFVVGDDVVILDDDLASSYSKMLDDLEIPWSPTKTLKSNRIGEFVGKVITEKSVIQQLKWKPFREDNALDLIRSWGPKSIDLAPKKWRPLIEKVLPLPYPYGCGFNPNGLSLDERFESMEELLLETPKDLSFVTSMRQLTYSRIKRFKNQRLLRNTDDLLRSVSIFDQKVERIVSQTLGKRVATLSEGLGKNLYSVNPDADLPLTVPEKSRTPFPKLKDLWNRIFANH